MKKGKSEAMENFAAFGIFTAFKLADGENLTPYNGRKFTIPAFTEYFCSTDFEGSLPEMVKHFLTFEGKHDFERAAEKRAEKDAVKAAVRSKYGL